MFHIALRMAVDLGHEEGQTHIYCLLANTALERGFNGQAERLFTEVLKRILADGEAQAGQQLRCGDLPQARRHLHGSK